MMAEFFMRPLTLSSKAAQTTRMWAQQVDHGRKQWWTHDMLRPPELLVLY